MVEKLHQKLYIILLISLGMLLFGILSISAKTRKDTRIYADPYEDHMDFYNTEVASKSISEAEKEKLTLKMQPFIERATQHAKAQQQRIQGTEPTIDRTPHVIIVHKLPDGIDEFPMMPLHFYNDVKLTNAWRGTAGEITYLVYAGALKADLEQGIVLAQDPKYFGFYRKLSPQKIGILRIIDYKDFTVILTSENGDILLFDAIAQEFINSFDEAVEPGELIQTAAAVPYPSNLYPPVTPVTYPGQ